MRVPRYKSYTLTCEGANAEYGDTSADFDIAIDYQDTATSASYSQNETDVKLVAKVSTEYLSTIYENAYWNATSGTGCYNASVDPIPICTCIDLNQSRLDSSSDHDLQNSIDFERCKDVFGIDFTSTGEGWTPLPSYSGTFDGRGFVIRNLYVNTTGRLGLFTTVVNGAVNNLGLVDVQVLGGSVYAGSVAGALNSGASMQEVFVSGTVSSTITAGVGGLVGSFGSSGATVQDILSYVHVDGNTKVGGIVGYSGYVTMENAYSTGVVTCSLSSGNFCGGLIGESGGFDTISGSVWTNYSSGTPVSCVGASGAVAGTNPSGCAVS